ncbi:hypothetical protein ACJ4V0_04570 [Phreatobacter sp. HK31-P]
MTPDETRLPVMVAPPLSPAASFDPEVAALHDVEWLERPSLARED